METVQHLPHLQDLRQNHDGAERRVHDVPFPSRGTWMGAGCELLPELRKAGYG